MNDLLEKGYARRCNEIPIRNTWHIPHHAVLDPSKPSKMCSIWLQCEIWRGVNKQSINHIASILISFHKERVAVMPDVESVYYQVWTHVFGGTSSGGCSNYAWHRAAVGNEDEFGKATASTLHNNYVDDLLKSVGNINIAKQLVKDAISMCKSVSFNHTKSVSNSKTLLLSIPEQPRRQGTKDQDLSSDLTTDKASRTCWNIEDDTFSFMIQLDRISLNKRKMLKMKSSIFDPLGFAAFVLNERRILQSICIQNLLSDMEVNDDDKKERNKFTSKLKDVDELCVRWYVRPDEFWKILDVSIHHFSDASDQGYEQCSYISMVDEGGKIRLSINVN